MTQKFYIVNICTIIDDFPKMLKVSSFYNQVYSSVGVYPLDVHVENGEFIHIDELIEFTKQKIISYYL